MNARSTRHRTTADARRAALRRTASISLGLGAAAVLPAVQSAGSSLLSDAESSLADDLYDDEILGGELEGADDDLDDATPITSHEEIDGPGTYELDAESTVDDATGSQSDVEPEPEAERSEADPDVDTEAGDTSEQTDDTTPAGDLEDDTDEA